MKNDILLAKWLNNDITPEELAHLKASPEYASYIKIAEVSAQFKTPTFDEVASFNAINAKKETLQPKVIALNPLKTFLKIAAVFAVIFAGYFYINSLNTTITTQIAEKQTFLLPDQSKVVLNANSTIDYNENNWDKNRNLTLDGEAYFAVSKGEKFNIQTKEGIVSVLGTQFNVFVREDQLNVICYEGLVRVSFNDNAIELPAGNKITIESGSIVHQGKINAINPSWIKNESSFDNAPLLSVIKELQRQYPIKVTTNNIDLNQRFSGSFSHENITLALRLLCEPLNLSYTIDKGKENVTLYAKDKKQ